MYGTYLSSGLCRAFGLAADRQLMATVTTIVMERVWDVREVRSFYAVRLLLTICQTKQLHLVTKRMIYTNNKQIGDIP